jgi:peptidoglycan/LPS O-acetylase OafA/YrhL
VRRVPEFDAIRGLAIAAVFVHHAPWARTVPGLRLIAQFGSLGVDVFFVLSGFLISSIIFREMDRPKFFLNFYARRAFRIWPIYYVVVFFVMLTGRSIYEGPFRTDEAIYQLTYLTFLPYYWSNAAPIHEALAHTWSLAVEEQFYILWPPLIVWLGRRSVPFLAIGAIITAVSARSAGWYHQILMTSCDSLAMGALLSCATAAARPATLKRALWALLVFALSYQVWGRLLFHAMNNHYPEWSGQTLRTTVALHGFIFSLMATAAIGLISLHAGSRWLAPLRFRPLVYLGVISYGVYLYHVPIYIALRKFYGTGPIEAVAEVVATLALAVVSWQFFEKPILALKPDYSKTTPPATAPALAADATGRAVIE